MKKSKDITNCTYQLASFCEISLTFKHLPDWVFKQPRSGVHAGM